MVEHFAHAPAWEWWILGYFFLAGISGGAYALGTMLRLWGSARDEAAARVAFITSFLALILCPVFLTVDLGQPVRFWHMLIDTGPDGGLALKFWSPMSLGAWALLVFGLFSFVSFVEALVLAGRLRAGAFVARWLSGALGRPWNVAGTVFGLFIGGYTGVLLSVSNQPVWSDAWSLGGLFLASGLSGAAAALLLVARWRSRIDVGSLDAIAEADRYFVVLEVVLIALFLATLAISGVINRVLGQWLLLWLVVAIGVLSPFVMHRVRADARVAALLTLIGVLALRAVVIFSAQS